MTEISDEMLERVARRLSALADPSRIRVLLRLREGSCTVGELAAHIGLAQPSISKHVAVLKSVGLVATERRGTQVLCSVAEPEVFELCKIVCDGVVRHLRKEHEALQGTLASVPPAPRPASGKTRGKERRPS